MEQTRVNHQPKKSGGRAMITDALLRVSYEKDGSRKLLYAKPLKYLLLAATCFAMGLTQLAPQAAAQEQRKPNIMFIMADDIGWMQVGVYHRGLALGETPNIDRIAHEGGMFMDY
jgi:hypothetical protein